MWGHDCGPGILCINPRCVCVCTQVQPSTQQGEGRCGGLGEAADGGGRRTREHPVSLEGCWGVGEGARPAPSLITLRDLDHTQVCAGWGLLPGAWVGWGPSLLPQYPRVPARGSRWGPHKSTEWPGQGLLGTTAARPVPQSRIRPLRQGWGFPDPTPHPRLPLTIFLPQWPVRRSLKLPRWPLERCCWRLRRNMR